MCRTVINYIVCPDCGAETRISTVDEVCSRLARCPDRNRRPIPQKEQVTNKLCSRCQKYDDSTRSADRTKTSFLSREDRRTESVRDASYEDRDSHRHGRSQDTSRVWTEILSEHMTEMELSPLDSRDSHEDKIFRRDREEGSSMRTSRRTHSPVPSSTSRSSRVVPFRNFLAAFDLSLDDRVYTVVDEDGELRPAFNFQMRLWTK